jgi:hypothetical protein
VDLSASAPFRMLIPFLPAAREDRALD